MINGLVEPFSPENTELMLAVQSSAYGLALAQQIRYERYCQLPEDVPHLQLGDDLRSEVHARWTTELLDADVDNLYHNTYTALLGQAICRQEGTDASNTELVVRALLVHDLAEAVLDTSLHEGDITYDEAQRRGEAAFLIEHAELGEILRNTMDHFGLDEDGIQAVEMTLNDSKKKPPQTEAGKLVELAERMGYMHSGLRAFGLAISSKEIHQTQRSKFFWMSENVLSNQLPRLVEVAPNRPSVQQFLSARRSEVSEALAVLSRPNISREVFDLYAAEGKEDPEVRLKMRGKASDHWHDYIGHIAA